MREFGEFVGQLQAQKIYLPNPREFNAKILKPTDFVSTKSVDTITLAWAPNQPADGTLLGPNEAGLYTAAGCPIIIAACDDRVAFAHAGQRCLLDTALILSQPSTRKHPSVVGALIQQVAQHYKNWHRVHVWVYWSIPPTQLSHPLNHPVHGSFNLKLIEYLRDREYPQNKKEGAWWQTDTHLHLDLPRIIATQAATYSLSTRNVHIGKFSYLPPELPTTRTAPGHNYIVTVVRH